VSPPFKGTLGVYPVPIPASEIKDAMSDDDLRWPPSPGLARGVGTVAENAHAAVANMAPTNTVTMRASTGQRIIIHLDTGEVDLCGLEVSEGARLFWEAVQRSFPPRKP
jgi:hypothetical protein